MSRPSRKLAILLFLFTVLTPAIPVQAEDVGFVEVAKLAASNAGFNDRFGNAVAVDGDTMVVAAWYGTGSEALTGAVYVYARNLGGAENWGEVARLSASDADVYDYFGSSVAIHGDTVVVGAISGNGSVDDTGSVYLFERNQGGADSWGEVRKITASDGAYYDYFGQSVAIENDTVVVGSLYHTAAANSSGAAYVFERNQGGSDNWGETTKLVASDATANAGFGQSVAISDGIVVVGANSVKSVYVFDRNHGGTNNWGEIQILSGSSVGGLSFGFSVSIDNGVVVVGGPNGADIGAAWVFERNSGGADAWGEVKRLVASDGSAADFFGGAVSTRAGKILIGASRIDTGEADAGAAYMFERNEGGIDNWGETQQLLATGAAENDFFGEAVSLGGDHFVIGAWGTNDVGSDSGSAYVFATCGGDPGEWLDGIEVHPSDGANGDYYGSSVSVSGSTMIVGANGDDGAGIYSGSAYVLERNHGGADNWGEVAKLIAADTGANDRFGVSVDVSGDTAVVGSFNESGSGTNSGAAYIFQRNHGGADNWGQVAKLTASDAAVGDRFGEWVAIDRSLIVVGAPYNTDAGGATGAAYVFFRNQGGADTWGEVAKLLASDAQDYSFFGQSVDVSGDLVAVGAPQAPSPGGLTGAVYLYSRNTGGVDTWGEVTKVLASDGSQGDFFGKSVSVLGGVLFVGAEDDDDLGSGAGSAYVFDRNQGGGDLWGQVAKLTASDGDASDAFGSRVGLTEGRAIVGAYGAGGYTGAAYVFDRNAGGAGAWNEVAKLTEWDATSYSFAWAVAIDGDLIAVGAQTDSDPGVQSGSVYLFNRGCLAFDFGDAPEPGFPTAFSSDGARHKLGGTVFLGAGVDVDLDGQPSDDALGDDTDAEGDDEDGVTFTSLILIGETADVDVVVSDACLLNAWVDFNDDGDWTDAGEQIFTDEALVAGTNSMVFPVPLDTNPGNDVVARFRVSTAGGLSATGEAADGEVEDHQVYIDELDFGDVPDPTYPTVLASNGARHIIGGPLYLGATVDGDPDGQPSTYANGDDNDAQGNDEDGVSFVTWLAAGQTCTVRVTSSGVGVVNAWIDFNADGDWTDAGEQIFTDVAVVAGANNLDCSIPLTAATDVDTFARFRLNSTEGLSFDGLALDGEVEDHHVMIAALDYGDAPDPTYPTLDASDGARHIIVNGFHLGASVDLEGDGQPTASADGDDTGGADDEDGVVFTSGLGRGLTASLEVTASATGLLSAWIDFNADGDWNDAGEQVFTDLNLAAGVNPLALQVPITAALGSTYARFRFSLTPGLYPNGYATHGEVEDYMVEIVEGPDLQIDMVASSEPAPSGRPLTYTITVTNNGPLPASSVTVTDTLPGEVVFVSSTPGGPDCTYVVDTLTCDLGTMAPTDAAVITVDTILDEPVYGSFSNAATVTAAELDPIQTNNTATVGTNIALFVDGFDTGDLNGWD